MPTFWRTILVGCVAIACSNPAMAAQKAPQPQPSSSLTLHLPGPSVTVKREITGDTIFGIPLNADDARIAMLSCSETLDPDQTTIRLHFSMLNRTNVAFDAVDVFFYLVGASYDGSDGVTGGSTETTVFTLKPHEYREFTEKRTGFDSYDRSGLTGVYCGFARAFTHDGRKIDIYYKTQYPR